MSATIDTPAFTRAIAELSVIPGTIELLRDDPRAFAARYELSAAQVEALRDAGLDRFREFFEDLLHKRLTLIQKFSPALVELLMLREDFGPLVREFARQNPSRSVAELPHKVVRDCQWFHDHVARWAEGRADVGPHLAPILAFERTQGELLADEDAAASARACAARNAELDALLAALGEDRAESTIPALRPHIGRHHRLVEFPCDIVDLVRRLSEKQPLPEQPSPPATTLLVAREPGRRSIRYIRVNARTRWLIERCDGQRSVAELVRDFRRTWSPELGDAAVFDGVWRLLSGMRALDMLSFELASEAPASAPN